MFTLLRRPFTLRLITWVMLGPFMIVTGGCHYFRVHSSPEPFQAAILKLQDEQKFIILHLDDKAWHFTDIKADDKNLTGKISALSGHDMYKKADPDRANRYITARVADQRDVPNEVHVHASQLEITENTNVNIPDGAITKVEVYSKAKGATAFSFISASLGILTAAFGVTMLIALLTSCPFIYVFNGADYVFAGEIFSGATQPGLERDDYLSLPPVFQNSADYKVKVTNELKERQYIDLAELILVDHGKDVSVLTDKNGTPYTVASPVTPVSAIAGGDVDVLQLVSQKDMKSYTGIEGETGRDGMNRVVLEFTRPNDSGSARLLVKARNSMWMETVSSEIHKLFGEKYNTFSEKREKVPGEKLQKWQLEQNLPLSVYIEKNNKWEFVDYFNIAGPATLRDDILPVSLEGISSDTVKIMLETGFRFWEIDYAAMDFSRQEQLYFVRMPLTSGTANDKLNVRDILSASDHEYFVLDEKGDQAVLVFDNPELKNDCRSFFLHTRGYYKVLRDQTGAPDKKTLRTFRKPGRMPEFSLELYQRQK